MYWQGKFQASNDGLSVAMYASGLSLLLDGTQTLPYMDEQWLICICRRELETRFSCLPKAGGGGGV